MNKRLMFQCRVKSSSITEKDACPLVTTKVSGKWLKGMLTEFNIQLENLFAGDDCWRGLNADQPGIWRMVVSDANTGSILGHISQCTIKNISGTRIEDGIIMGLKLEHPLTPVQDALEHAILTDINCELTIDMEVFGILENTLSSLEPPQDNKEELQPSQESKTKSNTCDPDKPPMMV